MQYIILILISTTFLLTAFIVYKRYSIKTKSELFAEKSTLWEELIFSYLTGSTDVRSIVESVLSHETLFLKFVLRFFENLKGEELKKLNKLLITLDMDKVVLKLIHSKKPSEVLEGFYFLRCFKNLPKLDIQFIESAIGDDLDYLRISTLTHSAELCFKDIFLRVIHIKCLPVRKVLILLNDFIGEINSDSIDILKSSNISEYQKSILIELLTDKQLFLFDYLLIDLIKHAENERFICKTIQYFNDSNNPKMIEIAKHWLQDSTNLIKLYSFKYLLQFSVLSEKTILKVFLEENDLWIKEEALNKILGFHYARNQIAVRCGVIQDSFIELIHTRYLSIT